MSKSHQNTSRERQGPGGRASGGHGSGGHGSGGGSERAADREPGRPDEREPTLFEQIRSYLIGLGLAAFLTAASFWAAKTGLVYGPGVPMALIALAVAQMGIHLVFFLHITTDPDNTNNVLALAFGILIVCIVMFGSLWIMQHLNQSIIPMDKLMQMQR